MERAVTDQTLPSRRRFGLRLSWCTPLPSPGDSLTERLQWSHHHRFRQWIFLPSRIHHRQLRQLRQPERFDPAPHRSSTNPPFRKSQLYFLMVCPIDRFSGRPSAFSSSLLEWLGRVFREGLHPRGRTVFQSRGSPQYLPLASITCFSVGFWFSTSTTCQDSVPC